MRRIKEPERENLLDYLLKEPEVNVFFIGIIENNCIDSDDVKVYVLESPVDEAEQETAWEIVLLKYYENYILYSRDDNYQVEAVVDFIKKDVVDSLNGKARIIRRVAPFFPQMEIEEKPMLRLDYISGVTTGRSKGKIRFLQAPDADKIVDLYLKFNDYAPHFSGDREEYIAECRSNLEREGIAAGINYLHKMVSVAEIRSDNNIIGLLAGIVTHPKYYDKGITNQVIIAVCEEAFRRGMKHICIFDDKPALRDLLKSIGFKKTGAYAVLQ